MIVRGQVSRSAVYRRAFEHPPIIVLGRSGRTPFPRLQTAHTRKNRGGGGWCAGRVSAAAGADGFAQLAAAMRQGAGWQWFNRML